MAVRVTIEIFDQEDGGEETTSVKVVHCDPANRVMAERLGQLIGYSVKAVNPFVVHTGSFLDSLEEVLI